MVIDFVNTLDTELATDDISTPSKLTDWLRGHELLSDPSPSIHAAQRDEAIALREGLRSVMRAHNGFSSDPSAAVELERVAQRGALSVRFDVNGAIRLEPRAAGFAGVLAQLLVPVAHAAADGTWERTKACKDEGCQWAFYDQSRNRSGRWCDMAVCGNRTKVRAYRTKRTDR